MSGIDLDARDIEGTPSRRSTYGKGELESSIPGPMSGLPRRKSGGLAMTPLVGRRSSSGQALREAESMKPPGRPRKLSGVGETF